jgi:radical SAM protein with 4Fe4S-binding SPASM domain
MELSPFTNRPRKLGFESLPEGYGFAFDFENPSGVKLLHPKIYSRLRGDSDLQLSSTDDDEFRSVIASLQKNPQAATPEARLTVWLHVINGCNFACHYCYIPHLSRFVDRKTIEKHSLGKAKIHPILNGLLAYCEEKNLTELHVNFAGGEPTLNLPLVEEFCREACHLESPVKITFGMISNGLFDAEELIPVIERYGISLSLSADGYEESHDRIRFELDGQIKRGSWKNLVKNVELLVRRGVSPYFLYTITPSNYRSIHDFAAYVHGNRLGFRFSLVRTKTLVSDEVQIRIANELSQLYNDLSETLDVTLPIFRYAAFAEWNLYKKKYVPCSSCRNYFALDTEGNVATCQMRMDRVYGNSGEEPFSKIVSRVHADVANASLSKPESRNGVCTQCEFFHVCASGCPQHNSLTFGESDRPSPWCHVYGTLLPRYIYAVARQLQRAALTRSP